MRQTRVALLLACAFSAVSLPAAAQTFDRGWIDVNFVSAAPAQGEQVYEFQSVLFGELAGFATAYPEMPRGKGLVPGAGVRIVGGLGVGFQFSRLQYEYQVGLGVDIPHPTIANRFASDSSTTADVLERTDTALDISIAYQVPTPDTWRLRVFGGPTRFSVKQDMVQDILYSQVFTPAGGNQVDITNFVQETASGSGFGFHVGVDVGYYFSRHVGVGGVVRMNRATIDIANEPLSEEPAELKLGATYFGGGLRIRF